MHAFKTAPFIKEVIDLLLINSAIVAKVFLTGKEKKPEVSEKRVYRISRKIIGFAILISDEI